MLDVETLDVETLDVEIMYFHADELEAVNQFFHQSNYF